MIPPVIPSTANVGAGIAQSSQQADLVPAVAGVVLFGLVGMVVRGDPESAITTLTRKVRQIQAGDYDVDLAIDRDDDVGRLYEAVDALTNTLRARERALRRQRRLLRTERERVSSLFENTTDCMAHVDLTEDDVMIREVNGRFESVFGYDGDAVEGESLVDLVVPEGDLEETKEIRQSIRRDEPVEREVTRETADGTGTFLFRFVPIRGDRGEQPDEGYAVYTDITERKERERELERYREYTDDVLDTIDDVFYVLDAEGNVRRWNERLTEVTGYTDEEVSEMRAGDFFDGSDRDRVADAVEEGFETGRARVEVPFLTKDGERVPHEFVAAALADPDGEPIVAGIGRDITERRERERELERHREYTDDVLDAIDDLFYVADEEGYLQRWNESLTDVTGYGDEEIAEMHAREFVAEEDRERLAEAFSEGYSSGYVRTELDVLRKDGERIPYEFIGTALDDPDGNPVLVGVGRDVSERKERERELERYETIIQAVGDPVYALDAEGYFEFVNDAIEPLAGYDPDELVGAHVSTAMTDADFAEARELIRELRSDCDEFYRAFEMDLVTADGDVVETENHLALLPDEDGEFAGTAGVVRDIRKRKRRERQFREANERLGAIVGASPAALVSSDLEGNVDLWNPAAERIFGWSADEVQDVRLPIVPDDRTDEFERLRERMEADEIVTGIETKRWTKDGTLVDVSLSAAPLHGSDGEVAGLVAAVEDISERKRQERELERTKVLLEQAQRVASVGGWEVDVTADPPAVTWTEELYGIFDVETGAEIGLQEALNLYHPEDRALIENTFTAAAEDGESYDVEARIITRSGEERWVRSIGEPVVEDGEVVTVRGSVQDVTDRKEREAEIERARNLLAQAQRLADVGAWELDVSGGPPYVPDWSDEIYDLFEISPDEELASERILEMFHPDDQEQRREAFERALEGGEGWDQEARVVTGSGETKWVRSIGEPVVEDGEVVRLHGSVQDITDQKEREAELERASELLGQSQRITEVGGWATDVTTDSEDRELEWTEKMFDIFELPGGEPPHAEDVIDYYHPDDREERRDAIARAFEDGEGWDDEARLITAAGNERWVRTAGKPVVEDGEVVRLYGAMQDITDRKEREAELERTRDLLRQAGRIAKFGGWELDLRTDPPEMRWDDELYRIHGVSPDTEIDVETAVGFYHPADREFIERKFHTAIENGEAYDMEIRLTSTPTVRWVRAIGEPVRENGEIVKLRGSIQDITDQKERELALRSLHDTARGLLNTESATEVADLVVEAAEEVVDVSGIGIYLFDSEATGLERAACSDGFTEVCGDVRVVTAGEIGSPLWDAFVTSTQTVVDDPSAFGDSALFGDGVNEALLVPLGDHGVVVVAAAEAIEEATRRLVETLAATTEAAFDRLESEESLRERDAELEAQNQRLRRQIQINEIIRSIDQSLIGANSQEEIEATVCERLAANEDIEFAWIGGPDVSGSELRPRARAGGNKEYLDSVSLDLDDPSPESSVEAVATEEPVVVKNVVDRLKDEPWRKDALSRNLHSVVSVPLSVDDYSYGVLSVYADEPNAFDDLECEVFAELGESIANSITAVKTRQALYADAHLELTLRVDPSDALLSRIAREADCEVEYEGMGTHESDETRLFFSTTGADAESVQSVLDDLVSVRESRLISESDDRCLFEATVSRDVIVSRLVRHGGSPRSMHADADGMEVVVDVPTTTDVREFVEMLRDAYPSVELAARRDVQRATHTRRDLLRSLFENLTDRQLEVLRTAYFSGFFEWPRESTGQEVAEMLGVSQPTVNRHLRLGQGRLLEQLFDDEESSLVGEGE